MLFQALQQDRDVGDAAHEAGSDHLAGVTFDAYAKVLDRLLADRKRIYSAAYIMPSPAFGSPRKHPNNRRLIEHMMRDGAARKLARVVSLREVSEVLRRYPSLGGFLGPFSARLYA